MRSMVLALVGWLSVASCATHVEPKCGGGADAAAPPVRLERNGAKVARATREAATDFVARSLAAIPRPTAGQFDSPERVLRFLFEKVASRDLVGSLVAFPVVEHFERVRLKDYQEYTGGFSPKNYPQDDAPYGRLGYSLNRYMATYREVSLRILSDDVDGVRSLPPGSDLSGALRELDGSRLGALRVASLQELEPESRPQLNAVDRALGVTEKRCFTARIALEQRTVGFTSFVGLIAGDWRVLSVVPVP
ncbi:MAG: hypothetical protein ABUL60_29580 [Myxococcales bacterium]